MNSLLMNAKGEARLFIAPKCTELLTDLKDLEPSKTDLINKRDPMRSHTSDGLGYFIAKEFPVQNKKIGMSDTHRSINFSKF